MALDANKVISDLKKADEDIRSAAKFVKSVKDYIQQSGVKAVNTLVPQLDAVMSALKEVCAGDVNSINSVIENIDRMPFAELKGEDFDDEDIFGMDDDFGDDDIYSPENYLADDEQVVSAIAEEKPATATATTRDAKIQESQVLRRLMRKSDRPRSEYKGGLDFKRIQEDMESDIFADVGSRPRMAETNYTSKNRINLTQLDESQNLTLHDFAANGLDSMMNSLRESGATKKIDEAGSMKFFRKLESGDYSAAQREVLNEGVVEKLQEDKKVSWQELGAMDSDIPYGNWFKM